MASKRLYHLSPVRFKQFHQQIQGGPEATDTGFHFGTRETALSAGDMLFKQGRIGPRDEVYLYEAIVDLGTPLEMKEWRGGSWTVDGIVNRLVDSEHPMFSEEELLAAFEDEVCVDASEIGLSDAENLSDWYGQVEEHDLLRLWLAQHGYDSIAYTNIFEGGGTSYVILDPARAEIVGVEAYRV